MTHDISLTLNCYVVNYPIEGLLHTLILKMFNVYLSVRSIILFGQIATKSSATDGINCIGVQWSEGNRTENKILSVWVAGHRGQH